MTNKIHKFSDYSRYDSMTEDFINSFDSMIVESDKSDDYKRIEKKVISDLKLNSKLIFTFGAGIGALYPIVSELLTNMSLNIEITQDKIVLLTIAAISIIYLEEKKFKTPEEEDQLTTDSKSMLEELKMMGIGNGIVKKLIKSLTAVKNIFFTIAKHLGAAVGGVIDMFAYTALLIPVMNGIYYIIGKYDLNLETIVSNFIGLAIGVGTIIAKHGLVDLLKKLKNKIPGLNKEEVIDEIETPIIQKFGDMTYGDSESDQDGDLIKEQ
jgi:hypothetical protein